MAKRKVKSGLLDLFSTNTSKAQSKQVSRNNSRASSSKMDRELELILRENERIDRKVNKAMAEMDAAGKAYSAGGDINKTIAVYEKHVLDLSKLQWNAFNYCLDLAELYVKANRKDAAWGYLNNMLLYTMANPNNNWLPYKIRFEQFKILKSEKKYKDALFMLVDSYVTNSIEMTRPYFNRNAFLKDVKTTAKGVGLTEDELILFTNTLESHIMARTIQPRDVYQFCTNCLSAFGKQ